MDSKKYLEDISEIKDLMKRSSRFISLSGLSGILAGTYALIGAFLAHNRLAEFKSMNVGEYAARNSAVPALSLTIDLVLIASLVALAAILTSIALSYRKAKTSGEDIWNIASRRLVLNFLIPLVSGGIFCLVLIQYGFTGLVAPAMLLFYGLACINASKYTFPDLRYLGMAFVLTGLISTQFIGYGLYFWALGFGIYHIIYGSLIYFKEEKA
ncbi:MAG: hypothetical protein CMH48_09545 [Muricauda sp.]|nr:hypothetical protein [Allomuricauda sp.]MAU26496.1 hypothetical protein [Allomuricauda sp.]MBC31078.1 hypothetical protein [Allomuricauda sp.]|tara:strand:+ start:278 stop:913 length:636 start_codon:yes stop_codon:yes gene_type:complete